MVLDNMELSEIWPKIKSKLQDSWSRFGKKANPWLSNNTDRMSFIKDFVFYTITYGLFINYAFFVVFSVPLKYYTFPAWGILFYFIKEEMPEIIDKCRR